jgi:hypothetical protein
MKTASHYHHQTEKKTAKKKTDVWRNEVQQFQRIKGNSVPKKNSTIQY